MAEASAQGDQRMSKTDGTPNSNTQLPELIVFGPPGVFKTYPEEFSRRFRLLKTWESEIPLEEFLLIHAQNTEAALVAGGFNVDSSILRLLPSLRFLVTSSVGLDHIDLDECRRIGVSVAYAPSIFSADVADLAVGLLIDVLRKISASDWFVKSGRWAVEGQYPLGTKVGGKRVGMVGLGSIGQEIAKRLEAFNCKISYQSRQKKPSVSYPFYSHVLELASHSDILIICCALNDQTHHLINKEVLLELGKNGVVINIARGAIIDERELVRCLKDGIIAGAGLDVFENEPEVPEELFELDNVVLSPHFAVYTEETFEDVFELMIGNLEAFFSGKPLLTPVFGVL